MSFYTEVYDLVRQIPEGVPFRPDGTVDLEKCLW